MSDSRASLPPSEQGRGSKGLTVPVALVVVLVVAGGTLLGILVRWRTSGEVNFLHSLFCLFFSVNLLICYWEICLFFLRDRIGSRAEYWREMQHRTGRSPAHGFFAARIRLTLVLSPAVWADAWAAYCYYDDSYADRRTFGFNVDIANGFVTLVPTLVLYAAFTVGYPSALVAGIIGLMLSWQWVYMTSTYLVSFFVARRHKLLSRRDMYIYIVAINSFWILCALLGVYVSAALIVNGDYRVLGL
ncbi:MAG: hypothetical protein F4Y31_03230 [Gammaproteobacteria bacterium]|nr:hypothetical protein [Gammaproteobacteria bacterium]MYF67414.1 hypothetical protein [Gammaproteobacteria bacterium]MYK36847.1 hypothetical protein [Gammaproteobacteria bacterium]